MRLNEYLTKHGVTQAQFGLLMNPPRIQTHVSAWITGRLRVSLADAVQIERLTNGEVSVEDWIEKPGPGETADKIAA